jgi:hypothetical protein
VTALELLDEAGRSFGAALGFGVLLGALICLVSTWLPR